MSCAIPHLVPSGALRSCPGTGWPPLSERYSISLSLVCPLSDLPGTLSRCPDLHLCPLQTPTLSELGLDPQVPAWTLLPIPVASFPSEALLLPFP